jgi:hypothetical protein
MFVPRAKKDPMSFWTLSILSLKTAEKSWEFAVSIPVFVIGVNIGRRAYEFVAELSLMF